jgi:hypothetical protein
MRPDKTTTPEAPWSRLAAEALWRLRHHLQHKHSEPVRRLLQEHAERLVRVLRRRRAA